ncbi:MAG TPA: hydroxymethylglutaryl-CoA reductase, degradative [Polyangiaceae bacterium]|jgi:hydroxymethylglutaryl-CoA reductase|nr:hydroxymethylglutaryl-CoA reductase, degradative [Polyangiaceae bacterium]
MSEGSRIPGFYKLSLSARRQVVSERASLNLLELEHALEQGGLDSATADKVVENVLGIYGLPFGVALNVRVNGTDRLVPMVVEEPSVIAAASNAARMVRHSGGFRAEVAEALMIGQVQITDVEHPSEAVAKLEAAGGRLLELATKAVPNLVSRGGGPRAIDVRDLGQRCIVLHVLVDCRDAMGANLVNTIAEAIGPLTAELAGGKLGLRILSNLCDRRRVHATCRVHARELVRAPRPESLPEYPPGSERGESLDGQEVVDAIVAASRFAELDPYRAATHNKGIMNGIDAVVLATGNDFRAVEAGAHAYAARSGRYAPLAVWRRDGEDLLGELELPLALGTVGGTLRVHPTARLALKLLGLESADELAMVAASVGLASNLSALRALATEGIQRGHMSLHARSVAIAAGALGDEVELVAARIATSGVITVESAALALLELSATPPTSR